MRLFAKLILAVSLLSFAMNAQTLVSAADVNAGGSGSTFTLTNDQEWLLDGFVWVEDGVTLVIEAGTVIRGQNTPANPNGRTSALIVTRGGRVIADGTPNAPIIFTALSDDLADPFDIPIGQGDGISSGLWGGVILLGTAPNNVAGGVGQIEGIDPSEPRGQYGCGPRFSGSQR